MTVAVKSFSGSKTVWFTLVQGVTQFFSESMNHAALRSLRLENGLRAAIEQDELVLHYQPLWDPLGETVHGVEALVRWQSPEFGLVSPGEFVPLAEETGLIDALGEWVLRTACHQGRLWKDAGLGPLRIAVNLSSHQLRKSAVVELVQQVLGESRLPAEGRQPAPISRRSPPLFPFASSARG